MKVKAVIKDIDVVILCGGRGKRLRSVVSDRPKPMVEIKGRPFLDILIEQVATFGFRRFILCLGHKSAFLERYYKQRQALKGIELLFSKENRPLGTAGAIKNAQALIQSNPFLVMNGDSLCRLNLDDFIKFHKRKKAFCSLVLAKVKNNGDYSNVGIDREKRIKAYSEKPKFSLDNNLISVGIYSFDKRVLNRIPKNKKCSLEYVIFPSMLKNRFYGFITKGAFIDIGTPKRLKKAMGVIATIAGQ